MKKTFKNVTVSFLGVFLMSLMLVTAMVYPIPFISNNEANVVVVYGASAAATDITAADVLINSLAGGIVTSEMLDRILSDGITEDEVVLGLIISTDGKIRGTLTDNQIPSLFDGKIDWHDGDSSHSYNVHEELIIGNLEILTTLDNNDFEGVVLTNERGLEYKYVFDDKIGALNESGAEALEVVILGEEYIIEEIDGDSITITQADKVFLSEGGSTTINGITLNVDSIYEEGVFINGVLVKDGAKKLINGVYVKVDEVYYNAKDSGVSKVEIYVGEEISKEYSDGDSFIGEDNDDPEWVWSIDRPGKEGGYIGVKYDLKQDDEEDDVVYEGGEYTFPHDFATVSFDGLTDVEYSEYEVFFDDVRLYALDDSDEVIDVNDRDEVNVLVIESIDSDSSTIGDDETDTVYLRNMDDIIEVYFRDASDDYNGKAIWYKNISLESEGTLELTKKVVDFSENSPPWVILGDKVQIEYTIVGDEFSAEVTNGEIAGYVLIYYADNADRFNNVAKAVYVEDVDTNLPYAGDQNAEDGENDYCITEEYVTCHGAKIWYIPSNAIDIDGNIIWGMADKFYFETDLITYTEFNGSVATLLADEAEMQISISSDGETLIIGNIEISLGEEDVDDDGTLKVDGTSIRSDENDVMDHYGVIIESPESNADDDRVIFQVPSEQVYAQISVFGSEEDLSVEVVKSTPAELNITKITDGQVATVSGKNIIVVGGPCINTLAAELLGGKYCGVEFTANTGVSAGQVLIQTFDRGNGNIVTLVAGYNAADTVRGVDHLLSNSLNIAVGEKVII